MNTELLFALISTVIYLSGSIFYWRDVLNRRTIPHVFFNIIGFILVGFNFYVLHMRHEYYSMIPLVFLLFSIGFFGIGYGIKGFRQIHINWFDYICFILSLLMLLYWYISRNVLNTVIFTCIIDLVIIIPVLKKSWLLPWSETSIAWFTGILNIGFLYLSQTDATIETSLYWLMYVLMNSVVVGILLSRRYYLKGWGSIFE